MGVQMTARNLPAIGVLSLLAVVSAHAQTGVVLRANVPFGFEAGGDSLPAGTYQFKLRSGERFLVLSGAKGGEMRVQIITQLAGSSFFQEAGLVFDTFGDRHVLSEVWIPGKDGVQVSATPKGHTHERVIAAASGAAPNSREGGFQRYVCPMPRAQRQGQSGGR